MYNVVCSIRCLREISVAESCFVRRLVERTGRGEKETRAVLMITHSKREREREGISHILLSENLGQR